MKTLTVELSATDITTLISALSLSRSFLAARDANEPIYADDIASAKAMAQGFEVLAAHIFKQRPAEMTTAAAALVQARNKNLGHRESIAAVEAAL